MNKMIILVFLWFFVGCSTPSKPPLVPEKDPKEAYELKHKTIDEFVKWLVVGESGTSSGVKVKKNKATAMKALDGATVKIDNKDFDCYIYDKEENWKFFDEYLKTIGSGSEISNFNNVRCITSGK
jgi:hypothetical protein